MKILHVNMCMDMVSGGGTVERTLRVHEALSAIQGVESHILSMEQGQICDSLTKNEVTLLPCLLRRWYVPFLYSKRINHLVKNADVISLMNHWTLINVWVYCLIRLYKKKYVFCPAGALKIYGRSRYAKKMYNILFGMKIIKNAARIIAITEMEQIEIQKLGIKQNKIVKISNGVKLPLHPNAKTTAIPQQLSKLSPYILFLGRLNSIKGPDLLLDAFISIKDTVASNLVLAGPDDGLKKQLEKKVENHNLQSRVFFPGYIGGEEKDAAYASAQMVVIPSRQEAMSIVALEAGVQKAPVILTEACGFQEIADCNAALQVDGSIESIADAIIRISSNKDVAHEIGENAYTLIKRKYSWAKVASDYMEVFQAI